MTRPVVPPGGSFGFWGCRRPGERRDDTWIVVACIAAMSARGLTTDSGGDATAARLSVDSPVAIGAVAGQDKSFPQNIRQATRLIRCRCVASVFLLADFFMAQRADVARGGEIVERWCVLAEQRLEHLTELFESGRWRRYHSEISFLENIQEAKKAVETWRGLLNREASADNLAVDLSWMNSSKPLPPRRNPLSGYYIPPPPTRAEPPRASPPPAASPEGLDVAVMQQRYPLLRNAL
ncbi:MAG TPA: TIGR03809 family protein [Bradyrhizobium sp.]|nr:TIGR03809 family protein [Bradyrhizobium sp.]